MRHVRWAVDDADQDGLIHFQKDSEWTLCGLGFEGAQGNIDQHWVTTKEKVTCGQCADIVDTCKKVKKAEISDNAGYAISRWLDA